MKVFQKNWAAAAAASAALCGLVGCESPQANTSPEPRSGSVESDASDIRETDEPTASDASRIEQIKTMSDGSIRPGGPVNKPVPGTLGSSWPVLDASTLAGPWQMRTDTTELGCRLTLDLVNSAGSGPALFEGDCPFADKGAVRWRFEASLGQIFLLDSQGRITLRLMRMGPKTFRAYRAEGWVFFDPEGA